MLFDLTSGPGTKDQFPPKPTGDAGDAQHDEVQQEINGARVPCRFGGYQPPTKQNQGQEENRATANDFPLEQVGHVAAELELPMEITGE